MIARFKSESGLTLIETTVATAMLLVAMIGLLSMAALATVYTENHGHLEARTTEYAQDKMEQLLSLAYTDLVSNTVVFPAAASGGTGLTIGGSITTSAPTNGFVDWLAYDGSLLGGGAAAPTDWYYERVWQITCTVAPCVEGSNPTGVKQVTVVTTVRSSVGARLIPKSTLSAFKAAQF
jgi:hypothetical protein